MNESENAFRLRARLKAACEDHEEGRMSDAEFILYCRRTAVSMPTDAEIERER